MNFKETDLGFEYLTDHYLVFFGKKDSSIENLKVAYPTFEFKSLWQVHSNEIVETNLNFESNSTKADAHWTDEKNFALISKSADCMPVLAINKQQERVLAIHAGWRGIESRIIPTALKFLGPNPQIFIGPHILKKSFEVQNDCFELLTRCTQLNPKFWYENGCVDLFEIALNQIAESYSSQQTTRSLIFDTKTDFRFHSYRRDGQKAGRQNSFIVRF